MEERNQNIEELFKESFEQFEAEVSPDAWANIQSGLGKAAASSAGAGAAKLSLLSKSIIGVVVVAVVSTAVFLSSDADNAIQQDDPIVSHPTESEIAKDIEPFSTEFVNVEVMEEQKTQSSPSTISAEKMNESVQEEQKDYTKGRYSRPQSSGRDFSGRPYYDSNYTYSEEVEQEQDEAPSKTELTNDAEGERTVDLAGSDANESNLTQKKPALTEEQIGNYFTPNFDGQNDVFRFPTERLVQVSVTIMDRNGRMVYEWNNLDGSWDGRTMDGQYAPEGTYIYEIVALDDNNVPCKYRGWVALFR